MQVGLINVMTKTKNERNLARTQTYLTEKQYSECNERWITHRLSVILVPRTYNAPWTKVQ